jgi:hypothetical protein
MAQIATKEKHNTREAMDARDFSERVAEMVFPDRASMLRLVLSFYDVWSGIRRASSGSAAMTSIMKRRLHVTKARAEAVLRRKQEQRKEAQTATEE